jgi:hypothetical protein
MLDWNINPRRNTPTHYLHSISNKQQHPVGLGYQPGLFQLCPVGLGYRHEPQRNSARSDWNIDSNLHDSARPKKDINKSHHTNQHHILDLFFWFFKTKRKKEKRALRKQPPPKRVSLLELPDITFRAIKMPDVAFRKDMTSMAPSTPSQEGMGFHLHRHRSVTKTIGAAGSLARRQSTTPPRRR